MDDTANLFGDRLPMMQRMMLRSSAVSLFSLLSFLAVHPTAGLAADCNAAVMYLKMADHGIEESRAWSNNSSDASESLSQTSMQVAEHYVDMAGQQFNESECGGGVLMWWFGDTWETYPHAYLVQEHHASLMRMLRDGRSLLRSWQARHWDRAFPGSFQAAQQGYHRLQIVASLYGLDTSGMPRRVVQKSHRTTAPNAVRAKPNIASRPTTCARPNVPATTLRSVEPDTPAIAQQQGISGTVQVIVSLDAASHVIGTRIQSSPSAILNQAALSAARESTFQTEIRDCQPVPTDLIYSVDFMSQ